MPTLKNFEDTSAKNILEKYFPRKRGNIIAGAERLQTLLTPYLHLGILEQRAVLVGGTNGKGSVCAILHAILEESGLKTGLYTSPHLVHANERIRIKGIPVGDQLLADALVKIEICVDKYLPNATFFEITTAAALLIFLENKVDFAIVEVGMGGKLDSTNACSPLVSVLTSVGLDHTENLGTTQAEIAFDKAHIGRRNRDLVIGSLSPEALNAVERSAIKTGTKIVDTTKKTTPWRQSVLENSQALRTPWLQLNTPNLTTAIATVEALNSAQSTFHVSKEHCILGLQKAFWPGRFDIRKIRGKEVIFEVAHNSAGFAYFLQQYMHSVYATKKCRILFACLNDKDWQSYVPMLPAIANHIVFTKVNNERTVDPNIFPSVLDSSVVSFVAEDSDLALEHFFDCDSSGPLLVTGSVAFVGEVMQKLEVHAFP